MSAKTNPIEVPPPHSIPDSAIDELFGRGLDRAGWRRELERQRHTWVPSLENRIIKREFWFYKAEIGHLLSAPNTSQGRKSKSNSRKSILKQLKGKTGERITRLSNGTLLSPDAKLRTLEHYVQQWQQEDPSYGAPAAAADINIEEDNSTQPCSSSQPMLPMMIDPNQDVLGEASSWRQPQPAVGDLPSSYLNTIVQHGCSQSDFEVAEWAVLHATMMSNPESFGDFALNRTCETAPAIHFEQSRLDQFSSRDTFAPSEASMDTVQNPSQETVDDAILREALTRELLPMTQPGANADSSPQQRSNDVAMNPQNDIAISSVSTQGHHEDPEGSQTRAPPCDIEMIFDNHSYFSDDDDEKDEDFYAQPLKSQNPALGQTHLAGKGDTAHNLGKKMIKPPRKELRYSNSVLRETQLRQQVIYLKSQSRASKKELEKLQAAILKRDIEIFWLTKKVKLLEIFGKQASQQHDDLAVIPPNESSPMDDIRYQNIVHQRRNDKIIQEAKASKQRVLAQKAASEMHFSGTDDNKENASQKGTASPPRSISRITPSKGSIPLGHALRFAGASSGNYAQQPESANNNKSEKTSETSTPAQSPIRRAGHLVRQISDTLLGRHRESIPPVPILRQWKEVHHDIQKRYTGDSGYESIDVAHERNSSMTTSDDKQDRGEGFIRKCI